jgi:segregation and condensation protein B
MNLDTQIESILLFKNEPITLTTLSKMLGVKKEEVEKSLQNLHEFYRGRGLTLVTDGDSVSLGTSSENSSLIESIQKEELSRELGRAGLETLAIILYKGPISRREIDHIRGVNSSFILRNLLIRGLIERTEGEERSYTYKPTLKLLQHLGVGRIEDLPEYKTAFTKLSEYVEKEVDREESND